MSSTFHHIFDDYWLCLDLSLSCVEINCFVPRSKTAYYGLVSLMLTREKGSVPSVTLVNLILLSDIEEIWVDGMFLPRESVRELSRVLDTRESARVFDETPIFSTTSFTGILNQTTDTENWEMKSLSLSHGRVFDQISHVLNTFIPGRLLLFH